ncbi:hypothetical protein [Brevundimonas sp.]|jgi:hypothetical protein|uniref:hypothetical protein n=1 Tax=Brevundimonas sp. TaxID=1871086 RepID=UPI0037C0ABF3
MITPVPSITMPDNITAPIAWEAADFITQLTDWRIIQANADPLTFDIEWDDVFAGDFDSCGAWETRDFANAHIAQWIADLIRTGLNKTSIRKMSLQVPQEAQSEPFLAGLKERVCIALSDALRVHYDQSLKQWERDARTCTGLIEDPIDQDRFRAYVGLDQVVSEDAARKAIKYVFHRMHWHLEQDDRWVTLEPDWRFSRAAPRRDATDEATRARALVCRCVDVLAKEDLDLRLHQGDQSHMTRDTLRDDLEKRFAKDGVWGLINLALVRDRMVFSIPSPNLEHKNSKKIVERQDRRLFKPHRMRWEPKS